MRSTWPLVQGWFGWVSRCSIRLADHVEAHRPGIDGVPVAGLLCELNSVIRQNRVDLIGHGLKHELEELSGRLSVSSCDELSNSELGRPVDADKEVELAFSRLNLGNSVGSIWSRSRS
jgi:hypothetical protein